jgi:SAM-dependent methyltransferase
MHDTVTPSLHTNLDREHRAGKARKMLRLLRGHVVLDGASVLEIGTGSGVIAETFKECVGPSGDVWAVDVVDQRLDRDAVGFRIVTGTALPFADQAFDLVVSNHVIEHVGDLERQADHVREIVRVLRPGGYLYLATPNRFAPVEPHFKLPLLSWLPDGSRSAYVRIARRGEQYDCWPLTRGRLVRLLEEGGLEATDVSREAIEALIDEERPSGAVRGLALASRFLYPIARPVLPSFIFLASRPP